LPEGARKSRLSALGVRANCPHGFAATILLTTDSPLTTAGGYSGEAAIPKRGHQEGTLAPPPSQSRFVLDLSAWYIQKTWNGVGLSPVSVIGLCGQATPPITPRVRGDNRILPSGDLLSSASACVSAWHPREAETRHLPPYPCLAPSPPPVTGRRWLRTFPHGKFEQGFLDEYGPAQV